MIVDYCITNGFEVLNLEFSPIKGPEGNIEYLVHIRKSEKTELEKPELLIEQIVAKAHETLD